MNLRLPLASALAMMLLLTSAIPVMAGYGDGLDPYGPEGEGKGPSTYAEFTYHAMEYSMYLKAQISELLKSSYAHNTAVFIYNVERSKTWVTDELAEDEFGKWVGQTMFSVTKIKAQATDYLAKQDAFSKYTAEVMINLMNIKSEVVEKLATIGLE